MSRREFAKRRNLLANRLPAIKRYVRPRCGFDEIGTDAGGEPYVQFLVSGRCYASLHVTHTGRNHLAVMHHGHPEDSRTYYRLGPRAVGRTIARHFQEAA